MLSVFTSLKNPLGEEGKKTIFLALNGHFNNIYHKNIPINVFR